MIIARFWGYLFCNLYSSKNVIAVSCVISLWANADRSEKFPILFRELISGFLVNRESGQAIFCVEVCKIGGSFAVAGKKWSGAS